MGYNANTFNNCRPINDVKYHDHGGGLTADKNNIRALEESDNIDKNPETLNKINAYETEERPEKNAYDLLENTKHDHIEQNTEFTSIRIIKAMNDKEKFYHLGIGDDVQKWVDPERENRKTMKRMVSFKRKGREETVKIGTAKEQRASLADRLGL